MIRTLQVGDKIIVHDGDSFYEAVVEALGIYRKAMFISRQGSGPYWLSVEMFLDWIE